MAGDWLREQARKAGERLMKPDQELTPAGRCWKRVVAAMKKERTE